jgi:hypothetical protein
MLRSQLVRRAMGGDTAALIFACKSILGLRESRIEDNQLSVSVSATANAGARPPFVLDDATKKKLYDAAQLVRREALRENDHN